MKESSKRTALVFRTIEGQLCHPSCTAVIKLFCGLVLASAISLLFGEPAHTDARSNAVATRDTPNIYG